MKVTVQYHRCKIIWYNFATLMSKHLPKIVDSLSDQSIWRSCRFLGIRFHTNPKQRKGTLFLDSIYYGLTHLRIRMYECMCTCKIHRVEPILRARNTKTSAFQAPRMTRNFYTVSESQCRFKSMFDVKMRKTSISILAFPRTMIMDTNILFEKRLARKSTFGQNEFTKCQLSTHTNQSCHPLLFALFLPVAWASSSANRLDGVHRKEKGRKMKNKERNTE